MRIICYISAAVSLLLCGINYLQGDNMGAFTQLVFSASNYITGRWICD